MVAKASHPYICRLYDGPNYAVMELIYAAHHKSFHRDLKPATLVAKQGTKLPDFGLAKQRTGLAPTM